MLVLNLWQMISTRFVNYFYALLENFDIAISRN